MKKVILSTLLSILAYALVVGQDNAKITIEIQKGPNPWSSLEINNAQETFQFAVVTDRTGGHRPGVFPDGVKKLNLLQPEFVMSVGDLIEGYTEDTAQLNWEWKQFNGFIDNLQMPFFYVPGNHDITNKVMEEKWKELFGRTYYHFIYKDVLFLCLNSEDNYRGAGRGTIDNEQYNYIQEILSQHPDVKWTLLFMHQPLWNQSDTKRWKDVENLLADRKHTVFVGHNHRYRKYERNNGKYFILATTGGGSSLRGPNFGEFDHVVWITMTDNGPIIANLLLEGIWNENVMTQELADFVFPISNNMPISLTPSFLDEPTVKTLNPTMKFSNDTDKLMKVNMEVLGSKYLTVDPVTYEAKINPNDVETLNLKVKSTETSGLENIEGLKLNVKISYEMEERPDLELSEKFTIKPAIKYGLQKKERKVKIDGKLKEWKDLPFALDENAVIQASPFTHQGNEDAHGSFAVNYDDDYLYVAAKIMDDELLVKNGENPLYQDAVAIFIDPRPAEHYNRTKRNNLFSDWIMVAASPDDAGTIYQKERLPSGTLCAINNTEVGYDVEVAIPISYLSKHQQTDWKNVRINLMISDYDQKGHHVSRISWKPIWTDEENYLGSGTFFK